MGCGNCGSSATAQGKPAGCGSNGSCVSGGCNKLNTYDWLKDMKMPSDYSAFNIVEVQFKGSRKEYYKNEDALDLYTGDAVVVSSDFGHDLGHVTLSGELVRLQLKKKGIKEDHPTIRTVYRKASEKDLDTYNKFKEKEAATLEEARTIAMKLRLAMKISDIEFQGDGRKVIFFYTAEERVDFRELIRRYASEFKTRIEMRQVSYREEASRLGGIGSCGRELCCSSWLTDYKVVSIGAAKTQNLSINMLKLSGQCGRLKCCLNYELETYSEAIKEFPRSEKLFLETEAGRAWHTKTDILKRLMWFAYPKSSDWVAIDLERVNEVLAMNKKGKKPETLVEKAFGSEIDIPLEPAADLISDQSLTRMDDKRKKKGGSRSNKKRFKKPHARKAGGNDPNKKQGQKPKRNQKQGQKQKSDTPTQGNPQNRQSGSPSKSQNRRRNRKPRPPKKD